MVICGKNCPIKGSSSVIIPTNTYSGQKSYCIVRLSNAYSESSYPMQSKEKAETKK